MKWGLYYDTLQIHYHADGKIEWNPWWCGRATAKKSPPSVTNKFTHLFGLNTAGDLVSDNNKKLGATDINRDVKNFVYQNKAAICAGISASAMYDQLLKPSGVPVLSLGLPFLMFEHFCFATGTASFCL